MITLYRRHSKSCGVHALGLPPRAIRLYMDCQCPIWMYGRTEKKDVARQTTGQTNLSAAQAVRASLLKTSENEAIHGPTIRDCADRFIAAREHEIAPKVSYSYRLLLERLSSHCEGRGLLYMNDLTVDVLEDFKMQGLPSMADTTKGNAIARLRCFLRVASRRGWTVAHLGIQLSPHRSKREQKEPYTDNEIESIFRESTLTKVRRFGYAASPASFRLLLDLMLETGMRIGDAVRFDPAALERGEHLWVYSFTPQKRRRIKSRVPIEAYLTDRLKIAIDECHWFSDKLPFWVGGDGDEYGPSRMAYDQMQAIGARCGVADCRPHRLRDTFAIRAILRGISLDDLARLLGHSSVKITEQFYAKWIPARARRLEALVAKSLMNTSDNALRNC